MKTIKNGRESSSNLSYAFKNGVFVRIDTIKNKAHTNASVHEPLSQNQLLGLKQVQKQPYQKT